MKFIANWILSALALILVSKIVVGVHVVNFTNALFAIFAISLLNILIKPILILLTLPITIVTLGLFTVIINAFLFGIAGSFTPGFTVENFGSALLGSLLYSLVASVLRQLVK